MHTKPPHPRGALAALAFPIALALLLALRLFHLGGPIDDPHSWRQCDTASQTAGFVRHGVDLLHPVVRWLGGHRTLIFEFPLPEAIAALLGRAFGWDPASGHVWDRVVALGFFLVSVGYFHACARELTGSTVASRVATLAYAASPLAMYYSRAAQVDFAAQALAHALLWHALRALRGGAVGHVAAAALLGALGALIKAPYLVPVACVLGVVVLARPSVGAFARAAVALGVPAVAFALWRRHVDAVNASTPDWTFLPGFYKEVNPLWWYVGELGQRFQPAVWIKLARRFVFEVASPALAALALLGTLVGAASSVRRERPAPSGRVLALAWLAGAFAYLLVFFPLNVIHNYYQTPFVAPLALLAGLGGAWLFDRVPAPLAGAATVVALAVAVWMPHALHWYRIDWVRVHAGEAIRRLTPANDLVVAVDRGTEFSDPRLLQRADRDGWPIKAADATPERLARLRAEGAKWIVWVEEGATSGDGAGGPTPPAAWSVAEVATEGPKPSGHSSAGADPGMLATVHVYSLERLASAGVMP